MLPLILWELWRPLMSIPNGAEMLTLAAGGEPRSHIGVTSHGWFPKVLLASAFRSASVSPIYTIIYIYILHILAPANHLYTQAQAIHGQG